MERLCQPPSEYSYVRLSRDNENKGDSNSIAHQIEILTKYAKDHGITNYKVYKDDGYSGTSFKRPGFQEMMADIEAGLVGMVVVKDMSRFGRSYLEVGMYTEIRFPEMGVRFIAVNDGVDSDGQMGNDFTPFRNIINEWYAKDMSKKIRAVFRDDPCRWTSDTIANILGQDAYLGRTTNFKTTKLSYKSKKTIENTPDKWVVFEGTIDKDTWEAVQKIREQRRRPTKMGEMGMSLCVV